MESKNVKKIKGYYEESYVYKFDTLDEIDKFVEQYILAKLTQKEVENLNSSLSTKKIKFII